VEDIDMGVTDARQVMSDEQGNAVTDWENSLPVFQMLSLALPLSYRRFSYMQLFVIAQKAQKISILEISQTTGISRDAITTCLLHSLRGLPWIPHTKGSRPKYFNVDEKNNLRLRLALTDTQVKKEKSLNWA
jgi:hypothetical protein